METYLTIASRREIRNYRQRSISDELISRIVDAGRIAGSSKNTQPWTFIVVSDKDRLTALASAVTRPSNLKQAAFAIAVVVDEEINGFDAGRAAQNMMLAAWDAGIGSCPNTILDKSLLGSIVPIDEKVIQTIISFGYPRTRVRPERESPEEWIAKANRKDREQTVVEVP